MPRLNSLDLFLKFSCFNVHSNVSPYNFNFNGKNVPFPSADVIMVALYYCSSVFFPQKGAILFFSFGHAFNKIAKPKCKRSFTELLKGYICYIFIITVIISSISNYSRLRDFQKYISSKNKRTHSLWRSTYAISAYKQILKIYISSSLFLQKAMKICFETSWY